RAAGAAPTPPRNRTLTFEYDLATARLRLNEDYVAPARPARWASFSPDNKTVVFARNHNLYFMDAASYEKALKNPRDSSIVETQLTTDGEEQYSYARTVYQADREQEQEEQGELQQQQDEQQDQENETEAKNARVPSVNLVWSRDSSRIAVVRRDMRK